MANSFNILVIVLGLKKKLYDDLIDLSAKWEVIGSSVGIPMDKLDKIRSEATGRDSLTSHCFIRVIDAWLDSDNPPKDENELADIVQKLGKGNLAQDIREKRFRKLGLS